MDSLLVNFGKVNKLKLRYLLQQCFAISFWYSSCVLSPIGRCMCTFEPFIHWISSCYNFLSGEFYDDTSGGRTAIHPLLLLPLYGIVGCTIKSLCHCLSNRTIFNRSRLSTLSSFLRQNVGRMWHTRQRRWTGRRTPPPHGYYVCHTLRIHCSWSKRPRQGSKDADDEMAEIYNCYRYYYNLWVMWANIFRLCSSRKEGDSHRSTYQDKQKATGKYNKRKI